MPISTTASSILAILNNINELIVQSSDRQSAHDVIKALRIYAKSKGFNIPEQKIDNFLRILLDARPVTLTYLIQDIANDVVSADKMKNKKNKINKKIV